MGIKVMIPYFPHISGKDMFKFLLSVALAAILALAPIPVAARPLPSVQPIQYQGRTFCTVFSIDKDRGYFASAGHCAFFVLERDLNGKVTILGTPATIEMIGLQYDVAVFHADVRIPALKLAGKSPEVCDPKKPEVCEIVSIQGFPYGLPRLITVTGHMAARAVPILHPSYDIVMPSDILDITVAGGNSGSPVFNGRGEVIGILWGRFTQSPHSLSIPLEAVRAAMLGYFED